MATIVITGASSGIGAEAARTLGSQGWDVAVVGRDPQRTADVATAAGGRPFVADFDRLDDVRRLADDLLEAYPTMDVLANNAGGLISDRGLSSDGHERTFQLNHLAPFLLTNLLSPALAGGRVISTSSVMNLVGHVRLDDLEWSKRRWLGGWRAYGTVKLETILFIRELTKRSGVEAYSFHPGYVSTGFGADSAFIRFSQRLRPGGFGVPVAVGAAPLVSLATATSVGADSGAYFDQLKPNGRTARQAHDTTIASDLWDATAALVGL